jgi:hypothetical protein
MTVVDLRLEVHCMAVRSPPNEAPPTYHIAPLKYGTVVPTQPQEAMKEIVYLKFGIVVPYQWAMHNNIGMTLCATS